MSALKAPIRRLPAKPDLGPLQRQAKELLEGFNAGDAASAAEVTAHFQDANPATFALHDAQLVIARSHGFNSWPKLKAYVDGVTVTRLAEAAKLGDAALAKKLLAVNPELARMEVPDAGEHRAIHFAVLHHHPEVVRVLMQAGADPRQGIYPHRDATSAIQLAQYRGYTDILAVIEAEEQHRREELSCPNITITSTHDQLTAAVRSGEMAAVRSLLDAEPDLIKACDRDGASVLHVAASALRVEMVEELLERRADVRKEDPQGLTPLDRAVLAANFRHQETIERAQQIAALLRARGAPMTTRAAAALGELEFLRKIDAAQPGLLKHIEKAGSLLTLAVVFKRAEVLTLLLDMDLDPDERTRLSEMDEPVYSQGGPLWHAAATAQHQLAEILLTHGANPNASVYASGTPMFQAFGVRDEPMTQLLRAHGGTINATTLGLHRRTELAREFLSNPDQPLQSEDKFAGDTNVEQMLWGAACGGDPEIVRLCLERITWPREDARWFGMLEQPLRLWNHGPGHWVPKGVHAVDRSTYPVCFKLILDRCDPNICGTFGARMLHRVAALGMTWGQMVMTEEERMTFAGMLLDAGARSDVRDDLLLSTPLAWACRWGHVPMVQLLIARGASVCEPEAVPWATPLAWARRQGHAEIESLLLRNGAVSLGLVP